MSVKNEEGSIKPTNPLPFLKGLIDKEVIVKLKWGLELWGTLSIADEYMNLKLTDVVEYLDGEEHGQMKALYIRCNNLLYVREKAEAG